VFDVELDQNNHRMDNFVQRVQDIAIGDRYHLVGKLGSGSFGNVYLGTAASVSPIAEMKSHVSTGRDAESDEVALKLEHYSVAPSLLEEEVEIYQSLAGIPGFPQVYWHGHQDALSSSHVNFSSTLVPSLPTGFQGWSP
jgi:serine/threonine protein kinase